MSIPPSNGETMLVTGINGFIGHVLGLLLLEKGFYLRGTARSKASTEPLLNGAYKAYKDRVTIFEVPDMTKDGAFDDAVKGCHGIFHVASPVNFSLRKYEQVIHPAIRGTTTLLTSAHAHAGPQLSSVVVTSSVAMLANHPAPPGSVISEASRGAWDFAQLQADSDADKPVYLYGPSKLAAFNAVWDFRDAHRPSFALTTIHPSVVFGPPAQLVATPAQLNETLRMPFEIISGQTVRPTFGSGYFVDVRDVALLHYLAWEKADVADGESFIASAGYGPNQAAVDILRAAFPERAGLIQDEPGFGPGKGYIGYNAETDTVEKVEAFPDKSRFAADKAVQMLGMKYRDFMTTTKDFGEAVKPLL